MKWGARGLPIFRWLCRLGSDADCVRVFGRRAPQERCVQLWFGSKPGGVMLPPEPDELTLLIYSCEARSASEKMKKCKGGQTAVEEVAQLLDKERFAKLVAPDE